MWLLAVCCRCHQNSNLKLSILRNVPTHSQHVHCFFSLYFWKPEPEAAHAARGTTSQRSINSQKSDGQQPLVSSRTHLEAQERRKPNWRALGLGETCPPPSSPALTPVSKPARNQRNSVVCPRFLRVFSRKIFGAGSVLMVGAVILA
jgi:hypothetical protein